MAISLQKGVKVSLQKPNPTLGKVTVNLNWNQAAAPTGFLSRIFGKKSTAIDLDLGCLYELTDGSKGSIQALGQNFGRYNAPPFIRLDGDDRSGENTAGENLYINGDEIKRFKRILIYTYIYEGVKNWKETDAVVTIQHPGAEDIVVHMDEFDDTKGVCALVLFENFQDQTFTAQKVLRFFDYQHSMDKAFDWGMSWSKGSK